MDAADRVASSGTVAWATRWNRGAIALRVLALAAMVRCAGAFANRSGLATRERGVLRSPVYRSLVASQQTPWTGHGRDFERLREYQPGDNYSEIAWKSTARRANPVTRLFQWEQKQEVYFVVDQSRSFRPCARSKLRYARADGRGSAARDGCWT